MKRIIAMALALLTIVMCMFAFSSCGKHECSICGEEKKCKVSTVFGEDYYVCADCEEMGNSLFGN